MNKLDEIQATHPSGLYKVEILVEGEWVAVAAMSKKSIIELCDFQMKLSDKDNEV